MLTITFLLPFPSPPRMTIVGFLTSCVLISSLLTHHRLLLQFGVGSLNRDETEEVSEEIVSWHLGGRPMDEIALGQVTSFPSLGLSFPTGVRKGWMTQFLSSF